MRSQRYGSDVLAAGGRRQRRPIPQVEAANGLVVEDAEGRFCGAVVGCDKATVTLEDRHGKRRVFPLTPAAFLYEGQPVTLVRPAAAAPAVPPAPTPAAVPEAMPLAEDGTVTDKMIADLLADPFPASRRPRLKLAGLVPVAHGCAALITFMFAVLAAIGAR